MFLLDFIGYSLEIIGNIGKLKVFLTFPLAAALEPQCEGGGVEVVEIHCNIGFIGKLKVFI